MRLKNNKLFLSLYLFGLFASALRTFPFPTNLNGKDTFAMSGIIQNLSKDGHFSMITSFFSYFGLAEPSYSLGALSFVGTLKLVTGTNISEAVLLYTFITFLLAYTSAFLLGSEYCGRRFSGGVITAVLFMMAPQTLQFLGNWNFSTRTLFLSMLPFLLLVLHKYIITKNRLFLTIFTFFIVLSFTFHRSSYFIIFMLASLVVIKFSERFLSKGKMPISREHKFSILFDNICIISYINIFKNVSLSNIY